jgi:hypothetical protein
VLIVHGDSDRLMPFDAARLRPPLAPAAAVIRHQHKPTEQHQTTKEVTMRAFIVSKYNEPLQEADVPEPVVGEHDVLVQVQAAGLNVVDEKIRAGAFKSFLRYELPQVMGSDVAGTVIGVGAKVWAFALGDPGVCPASHGPHRNLR